MQPGLNVTFDPTEGTSPDTDEISFVRCLGVDCTDFQWSGRFFDCIRTLSFPDYISLARGKPDLYLFVRQRKDLSASAW
jgi:hypothetical protein